MPKILEYTPDWLSRPSPGFKLFSSSKQKQSLNPLDSKRKNDDYDGPNRMIARRGTEVFVVVDDSIRWADLGTLKDSWGRGTHKTGSDVEGSENEESGSEGEVEASSYKVLQIPFREQIRQLVPSNNGDLMAFVTSHTIYIAVLPESSRLSESGDQKIRLKVMQLGSHLHIHSQPPVASVLWHPLGVRDNCLVTITAQAVVRVWELNVTNRWSFHVPTLDFDLKKLAYGKCADDDFAAESPLKNKIYTVDDVHMEVASACFGGIGSEAESGWCSMTLWIAMEEGDIYALCPLLPTRWKSPWTQVPTLTTSVAAKWAYTDLTGGTKEVLHRVNQQYNWLKSIDEQEPMRLVSDTDFSEIAIYKRPAHPGPIPRLQGPFRILPEEVDEGFEVSSIHVIAAKVDSEELVDSDLDEADVDERDWRGLSASIICLATKQGDIWTFIDLDGVEADWLPKAQSRYAYDSDLLGQPELVLLEQHETFPSDQVAFTEWPIFTLDPRSRYSFFLTHTKAVVWFSFEPWCYRLDRELRSSNLAKADFRLDAITSELGTKCQRILNLKDSESVNPDVPSTACVVSLDNATGYLLLTTSGEQPQAVLFDEQHNDLLAENDEKPNTFVDSQGRYLATIIPRQAYQPPSSLWAETSLKTFMTKRVPAEYREHLTKEVRLSPATLEVIDAVHDILSADSRVLDSAAASVHLRCDRMKKEFADQRLLVNQVVPRIIEMDVEQADDYGNNDKPQAKVRFEERIAAAKKRSQEIAARHDAMKSKLDRLSGQSLSLKEKKWIAEVKRVDEALREPENGDGSRDHDALSRYFEIQTLVEGLIPQAKQALETSQSKDESEASEPEDESNPQTISLRSISSLLDKETTLVNAAQERLEQLSLGALSRGQTPVH
ncbi:MAG: hypothetical protein MMC33_004457 [Icmadophila ericetorum]|nr:hypothetical protein [Icmadophila ericetorum]